MYEITEDATKNGAKDVKNFASRIFENYKKNIDRRRLTKCAHIKFIFAYT